MLWQKGAWCINRGVEGSSDFQKVLRKRCQPGQIGWFHDGRYFSENLSSPFSKATAQNNNNNNKYMKYKKKKKRCEGTRLQATSQTTVQ